jgi:uncharacterized protein (DUF1697 family)
MSALILLLRGVMPRGKNKVPMARLREELSHAGFGNPRTYIQSGNILVETDLPAPVVERKVHEIIRDRLGPDLAVIARTGAQLEDALEKNPFREGYDSSRVFFVLFERPPAQEKIRDILSWDYAPEELSFGPDGTAYMFIPGPYGRGTLSNAFLEKQLGAVSTMRNFNTVARLAEMGEEL